MKTVKRYLKNEQENMNVNVVLLHSLIYKNKIYLLSESLSSIAEVEKTLRVVHELKVCNGFTIDSNPKNIQTTFSYSDKEDILRHVEGSLYLPKDCKSKKCDLCSCAKRNLMKKIKWLKGDDHLKYVRCSYLNSIQRRALQVIKEKLKKERMTKDRAVQRLNELKNKIQKCKTKIVKIRKETTSIILLKKIEKSSFLLIRQTL